MVFKYCKYTIWWFKVFLRFTRFDRAFMNKYAFLTEPARTDTEIAESYGRLSAAKAKHCEPRGVSHGVNRYLSLLRDKSFSLTIRADDGSTLLETRVKYMHQAFQTLIDWSIDKVSQDACATISGPNGFYTNHRIKASRGFGWIESAEPSIQLRS